MNSVAAVPAERRRSAPWPILLGLAVAMLCLVLAWSHGGLVFGKATGGFNPIYAVSGLAIGTLVGLTGIGGGSLMTPLLVLIFGFHPGTAVGTDLLYASATKSVGTMVHSANRTIDWRVTGRLALGSIPATILTVGFLYLLRDNEASSSKLISTVLGLALLLTAVALLFRGKLLALAQKRSFILSARTAGILTVILGAALGILITLSSVGAGAIGVTVLIFLYPEMPLSRIVGSDIAHAVPLTLIAGAGHLALGTVNLPLLASLLVGSIPGIIVGSHFAARAPDRVLRPILAATLLLVGGRLVF
jgi:uncharacterized membrane protein YfcA